MALALPNIKWRGRIIEGEGTHDEASVALLITVKVNVLCCSLFPAKKYT